MDGGLFDEVGIPALDRHDVGMICTGKIYDHVRGYGGSPSSGEMEDL
jgi:hypothetical protein